MLKQTAAARLVVPDLAELVGRLEASRLRLARGTGGTLERTSTRLGHTHERLARAPALLVERQRSRVEHAAGRLRALSPKATLGRGYAIVRSGDAIVRSASALGPEDAVDVELAEGGFGARVEETRP